MVNKNALPVVHYYHATISALKRFTC